MYSKTLLKTSCILGFLATGTMGGHGVLADTWRANTPDDIHITENATSYSLKYGDTLWAVSQKISIDVPTLAELSNIDLSTGQEYSLPVGYVISWSHDRSHVTLSDGMGNTVNEVVRPQTQSTSQETTATVSPYATSSSETHTPLDVATINAIQSIDTSDGFPHVTLKPNANTTPLDQNTLSKLVEIVQQSGQPLVNDDTKDELHFSNGDALTSSKDELHFSNGDALTSSKDELHFSNSKSLSSDDTKDELHFTNGESLSSDDTKDELHFTNGKSVTSQPNVMTLSTDGIPTYENGDDVITVINPKNRWKRSSNFVLIESNGHYGLLDAGTGDHDNANQTCIDFLKAKGIKTLDFVMLSHNDEDHVLAVAPKVYRNEQHTDATGKTVKGPYNWTNSLPLLYDNFEIKSVYLKDIDPAIKTAKKAEWGNNGVTPETFYNLHGDSIHSIIDAMKKEGANVNIVTENQAIPFGDFTINLLNTQNASTPELENYCENFASMVELVTKTTKDGQTYNALIMNDTEWYDMAAISKQLDQLGVKDIDVLELNHHGWSQLDTYKTYEGENNYMVPHKYGAPVTFVTNGEEGFRHDTANDNKWAAKYKDASSPYKNRYEDVVGTYTNGLYWQDAGSIKVDFSDIDTSGVTVTQEGNKNASNVTYVNGKQQITQNTLQTAPTEKDIQTVTAAGYYIDGKPVDISRYQIVSGDNNTDRVKVERKNTLFTTAPRYTVQGVEQSLTKASDGSQIKLYNMLTLPSQAMTKGFQSYDIDGNTATIYGDIKGADIIYTVDLATGQVIKETSKANTAHNNDVTASGDTVYSVPGGKTYFTYNKTTGAVEKHTFTTVESDATAKSTRLDVGGIAVDSKNPNILYLVAINRKANTPAEMQSGDGLTIYKFDTTTNTQQLIAEKELGYVSFTGGAAEHDGVLYIATQSKTATNQQYADYTGIDITTFDTTTNTFLDKASVSGHLEGEGVDIYTHDGEAYITVGVLDKSDKSNQHENIVAFEPIKQTPSTTATDRSANTSVDSIAETSTSTAVESTTETVVDNTTSHQDQQTPVVNQTTNTVREEAIRDAQAVKANTQDTTDSQSQSAESTTATSVSSTSVDASDTLTDTTMPTTQETGAMSLNTASTATSTQTNTSSTDTHQVSDQVSE